MIEYLTLIGESDGDYYGSWDYDGLKHYNYYSSHEFGYGYDLASDGFGCGFSYGYGHGSINAVSERRKRLQ